MSAPKSVFQFKLLIFVLISTLIFFLAPTAHAQSANSQLNNMSQYTDALLSGLTHTLNCVSTGISLTKPSCNTTTLSNNSSFSGGALGLISKITSQMFITPPIHTANYIASITKNLGFAKPAYAQVGGTGNDVIQVVLTLWQVSRNLSYIIMIIIFLVIGLMVMFRSKVNPQTVITVQAALPGLIIGLVLITFSYFFAALIVDTGFLGSWVAGYYFAQSQPAGTVNKAGEILSQNNLLDIFGSFFQIDSLKLIRANTDPIVTQILTTPAELAAKLSITFLYLQTIGQVANAVPGGSILAAAGAYADPQAALGNLVFLGVGFMLLYSMVKLLLKLINNYIMILLLTFTAPFHFLAASLPGRSGIATDWVRNMLCNVLAFPAVFAGFYFAAYILGNSFIAAHDIFGIIQGGLPATIQSLPLFQNTDIEFIRLLVAFGILMAIPAIPDVVCKTIGKVGQAGQIISGEVEKNIAGGRGQAQQVGTGIGQVGGNAGKLFQTKTPPRP